MPTDPIAEFRTRWLPHITPAGLDRLVDLLGKASPLLIHGAFTRSAPMGCLATHVGWNHPRTTGCGDEAGVLWLCRVAGLNPATSAVIQAWDRAGVRDFALRSQLLAACEAERARRAVVPADAEELAACCC